MLKIRRFINQLMYSNCYVVYDEDSKKALVIDPASEKSTREIAFIDKHRLELDYIIREFDEFVCHLEVINL